MAGRLDEDMRLLFNSEASMHILTSSSVVQDITICQVKYILPGICKCMANNS